MSRKKNDLRGKDSEKAKQERELSTSKVEFELPDEELEDVSGGTMGETTAMTMVTMTIGGGRAK
jgi:hypothetical protein